MKSSLDPARRASILLRSVLSAAALAGVLAGCGQKGPLTMPVRPAPLATTPAPPAAALVPAAPPAPAPVPVSPTPVSPVPANR